MQIAPSFSLTSAVTTREVTGPPGPSIPLLLIFHGYEGEQSAIQINVALRNRFPSSEELQIVSVIDLGHIPSEFRPSFELTLANLYRIAAELVPNDLDPTEYVIILPDWDSRVTTLFGMQERIGDIGIAIITPNWEIFDSFSVEDPLPLINHVLNTMVDGNAHTESAPTQPA